MYFSLFCWLNAKYGLRTIDLLCSSNLIHRLCCCFQVKHISFFFSSFILFISFSLYFHSSLLTMLLASMQDQSRSMSAINIIINIYLVCCLRRKKNVRRRRKFLVCSIRNVKNKIRMQRLESSFQKNKKIIMYEKNIKKTKQCLHILKIIVRTNKDCGIQM